MKTINDDPEDFFANGGWSFLDPNSDVSESCLHTCLQSLHVHCASVLTYSVLMCKYMCLLFVVVVVPHVHML